MSATLTVPDAAEDRPQSLDDEPKMVSTTFRPPAQRPLALPPQSALSPFDRAARDFPDLFILASSC